jgi:hypothetical protein
MLTNTYDATRIKDSHMKKIVSRCTAFSPEKRFPNATKLKRELLQDRLPRKKILIALAASVAIFTVAFAIFISQTRPAPLPLPTPPTTILPSPPTEAPYIPYVPEEELEEYEALEELPSTFEMPVSIVYSLAHDTHIQSLPTGTTGHYEIFYYTPFLMNSGLPTFTIVPSPFGGNAIHISNRFFNYNSFDLVTSEMNLSENSYTLTVTGNIHGGGVARIAGADNPWTIFTYTETSGIFTLQLEITPEILREAGFRQHLRILTWYGNTNDLTIYAITIVAN